MAEAKEATGAAAVGCHNYVLEAARASAVALHSAAGLSAGAHQREPERLLRVAEGLARSAASLLQAARLGAKGATADGAARPGCGSAGRVAAAGAATSVRVTLAGGVEAVPTAPKPGEGKSRSARRRRTRRQKTEDLEKEDAVDGSGMVVDGSGGGGAVQVLALGDGSVVVGDLSELYGGEPSCAAKAVAAAATAAAPSSTPPASASSGAAAASSTSPAATATSDPALEQVRLLRERAEEHGPEAAALLAQIEKAMCATTRPPT